MKTATARSARPVGRRSCHTSAIWWHLGKRADPDNDSVVQQLKTFLRLYGLATKKYIREVQVAWHIVASQIETGTMGWRRATGPMTAAALNLKEHGWDIRSMDDVTSPSGDQFDFKAVREGMSYRPFLDELERTASKTVWETTSKHKHGRGLDSGIPTMEPARAARKWLERHGHGDAVLALDAIVTGCLWHGPTRRCKCGEMGDARHRYWTCNRLDSHEADMVRKSNWMRKLFTEKRKRRTKTGSADICGVYCQRPRTTLTKHTQEPTTPKAGRHSTSTKSSSSRRRRIATGQAQQKERQQSTNCGSGNWIAALQS